MAEKTNEKNEKMTEVLGFVATGADKQEVNLSQETNGSGIGFVDLSGDQAEQSVSYSDVVETGTFMQRISRGVLTKDNKPIYEYAVGFSVPVIEGLTKTFKARFRLRDEYTEAYEMLDVVFINDNKAPLSIRRTERTYGSGRKSVSYSAEVSIKLLSGTVFEVPLVPDDSNDQAKFNLLVQIMKDRGLLR